MTKCVFCEYDPQLYLAENECFFAIPDKYPVGLGHTLIISKRHCETFFELNPQEVSALQDLSLKVKAKLEARYPCDGFNLVMNCGRAAHQSVAHFHMHIIPRQLHDRVTVFQSIR